ncbi:polysaccharide biosynthesis protein GumN [Photobacterium proteolyticum]|uniref:Polysaccharide biosynthesis protein GumN n=1 Tax=Photobacterium proteolyticum TaxID=1903952 RepID=A0A1Q9GTE0_9GAMM|nr:TraB/GumN family protein [Photobacterium proteolyticum]OLQ78364.1 polysaccharide biosynthesis protein GumN [Photobacterium proteolyticum]
MFKSILSKALLLLPFITTSAIAEPLAWLAKDSQRQFVLLGSIHAGEQDFYPLPQAFLDYWPEADGLVVEANILESSDVTINRDIPTSGSLLDNNDKEILSDIAKQAKLPYLSLIHSPPWLTAMNLQMAMVSQAGLSPLQGVDVVLLQRAQQQQLPILELESVNQQVALMENLPDYGEDLLLSTIREWSAMQTELNCLVSAWKAGDLQHQLSLMEESQYSDETEEKLIFERNRDWANQLTNKASYQKGTYLVVVGAMHMLGDQGLPTLLEKQGFTLKRLTEGEKSQCE